MNQDIIKNYYALQQCYFDGDLTKAQFENHRHSIIKDSGFKDRLEFIFAIHEYQTQAIKQRKLQQSSIVYRYLYTQTFKNPCQKSVDAFLSKFSTRFNTLGIVTCHYSVEHPESNIHVHMVINSTKMIKKDRLKSYNKYGFIDLKRLKTQADEIRAMTYINKENKSSLLNSGA